jgi:hypothetical protein
MFFIVKIFIFIYRSGYLSAAEYVKNNTVRDSQTQEHQQSDTDDD